jgi:hypothetical protein
MVGINLNSEGPCSDRVFRRLSSWSRTRGPKRISVGLRNVNTAAGRISQHECRAVQNGLRVSCASLQTSPPAKEVQALFRPTTGGKKFRFGHFFLWLGFGKLELRCRSWRPLDLSQLWQDDGGNTPGRLAPMPIRPSNVRVFR